MKKSKHILILISALILLLLTGCGDPMVEMTDEEQDIIVRYIAHVVGEYNIYQKDGMTGARPEEEQESTKPAPSESESESGGGTLTPGGSGGGSDPAAPGGSVTLTELIDGGDGLAVTYDGLKIMEAYVYEGAYSLDAGKNFRYAALSFTLTNAGKKDLEINNFDRKMSFSIELSDGSSYAMENTMILPNDLATYHDTLKAGKVQKMVLLFRIPKDKAAQTEQFKLYVTENKVKKSIKL